jgi:hypothetical protein
MTTRARTAGTRAAITAVLALVLAVVLGACGTVGSGSSSSTSGGTGASGDVVWRSGTTTADAMRGYRVTPWNADDGDDPRAVDSPDVDGRGAVAFTVPGGGTRSELEPGYRSFREGDEFYFGLSLYLPDGFPVDTSDWQVVAQWKNSGDGSPPVSVSVQQGRFILDGGAGVGEAWQRDIGPARTGVRTDLVVGIHFSSDPSEGTVDVWQGGRHVVSDYRPSSGTLYEDEVSYLKVGLYRSDDIDTEGTVYYDDVVIARSRDAVGTLAAAP